MAFYDHDSETATYDQPGLQYDNIPNLTIAGTTTTSFFIPFRLTAATAPTYTPTLTPTTLIPAYMGGGLAVGGSVLQGGPQQFPKITLEGTIDVTTVDDTEIDVYAGANAQVPNIQVNSIPMHWVEVLQAFFEGRYFGYRYDPTYYRDPYGRVYNFPRMYDYTATYAAGQPQRHGFTMVLMLKRSAN